MAYVAPSTRTTGTLITAVIWNADVVANPIALYAGAMSIALQAANDLPYFSSTTQIGRIAAAASSVLITSAGSVPSLSQTLPTTVQGNITSLGTQTVIAWSANTPAVVTSKLYTPDGASLWFNGAQLATGASVSGTSGKIAKFTATTTIGDSIISDTGTTVTVAGILSSTGNFVVNTDQFVITASTGNIASKAGIVAYDVTSGSVAQRQTTTDTTGVASLSLQAGTTDAGLAAYGQAYSPVTWRVPSTLALFSVSSGGISIIADHASADVRIWSRGALAATFGGSQATTLAGLLTVSGAGIHTFSAANSGSYNTVRVVNSSNTAGSFTLIHATEGVTANLNLRYNAANYGATSGIHVAAGGEVEVDGAGGLSIAATHADGDIRFYAGGSTQRMKISRSGAVTIDSSNDVGATTALTINQAAAGEYALASFNNTTDHNDTTHYLLYMSGNGTQRAAFRSNGGLANFSANNVNLSDASTKDISGPVASERAKFSQLQLVRGRYKDSKRAYDDVMVTAQQVEAIYPDLVEWFDKANGLKGVREHGLMMRAFRVIQELDTECVELRQRLSRLEN